MFDWVPNAPLIKSYCLLKLKIKTSYNDQIANGKDNLNV